MIFVILMLIAMLNCMLMTQMFLFMIDVQDMFSVRQILSFGNLITGLLQTNLVLVLTKLAILSFNAFLMKFALTCN